MFAKPLFKLPLACCVAALALPLPGCGPDTTRQGPELGELKRYLDEHPELMETVDEEMDEIEGNEFDDAGAS